MARPLIDKRKHTLVLDVPPIGLPVRVDVRRMAQVVANLLTNAAKYSPEQARIEVSARRDGAQVRIGVRDDGIGIDPELLPRVFEMFYQVHASGDRSGLGIGLALVKSLVTLHGGQVAAFSRGVGRGSEFVVTLPLAPLLRQVQAAPLPAASPAPVLAQRVVVVDDNQDAAAALQQLLEAVGHPTRVAHDAAAALQICQQWAPSVAVLDIGLPGVDGYQLAQMIHQQMGRQAPRLLALSGYGLAADAQRSQQAGFAVHLVKPVDVERLLAEVARSARSA
jgi:CheY-like chemotaxis protein